MTIEDVMKLIAFAKANGVAYLEFKDLKFSIGPTMSDMPKASDPFQNLYLPNSQE